MSSGNYGASILHTHDWHKIKPPSIPVLTEVSSVPDKLVAVEGYTEMDSRFSSGMWALRGYPFFSVLYAPSPMPLQEAIKRFSNIFFKRERAYMREKWLGR